MGLSAAYGSSTAVLTIADWPWTLLTFAILLLFMVVQGLYYGQIGRGVLQEVDLRKGTTVAIPCLFPPLTLLVRGSDIAMWTGPILGLITFAVTYAVLKKHGYFYKPSRSEPELEMSE